MKTMMKPISQFLIVAFSVGAIGCAQQMDDINKVQNNVTLKAEIRGEFYFRSTVVEAPYASFGYFVGDQNYHMERGVFEITEKTLYFYRTYEHAIGGQILGAAPDMEAPLYQTDKDGNLLKDFKKNDKGEYILDKNNKKIADPDGGPIPVTYERRIGNKIYTVARYVYRGSPIVAFPISSHFDIQRSYNVATGEKSNVISENTTDRQWWERTHMRVNWGASKVAHYDSNLYTAELTAILLDGEADPYDQPVKVYNDENTLDYFDYQVKKTVTAPLAYYGRNGYEYIPACWYYPWYLGQIAECNSEQITFRQAFMKVKPRSYVAWDYDDTMLKKFGYYRIERATYEPTRGVTYSGVSRRIRRFAIWEDYIVKKGDPCLAPNGDVTVECGDGMVCEPVGNEGKFCVAADPNDRLDYANMTPKPIVFYLSEEFPRELVPESIQLAEHWDRPFTDVVKARKGEAPGHPMYILCENNTVEATAAMKTYGMDINNADDVKSAQAQGILAGIDGYCLDMDNRKRNGDLRYSQLHSVNAPTAVGLYGYGPSSADPMTGELLSANSYMYTPAMKRGANNAMLLIETLTGIKSFWETRYANQVKEHSKKNRLGAVQGGLPKWTESTAKALAKNMLRPQVAERIAQAGFEQTDANWAAARLAKLPHADPHLAKMFISDDVKMLLKDPSLGMESTEPIESQVERMGLHKWSHAGGFWAEKQKYYEDSARNGCKFLMEFADNAILGIAREFAAEMNDRVCDAAEAAENTVFDFSVFQELGAACDSAGLENENGQVCEKVIIDTEGTEGLYWATPCSIGSLKAQLANAIVDLEQTNPYNVTEDYFPPDPIYTDTKHASVQNSQMAMLDAMNEARDDMRLRLWKRIYLGVAEHEVGHSIGLRHNFEASTDAMNFEKRFWELKGQFDDNGKFVPYDLFSGETFYQSVNSMRQKQSSSVMDYSAKFNDRFDGVGYYDRAAVKYGYGGLVEVFNGTPNTEQFAKYLKNPEDQDPSNVPTLPDPSNQLEKTFKRVHYTKIPDLFGNIDDLYDRKDVPYTQIPEGSTEVPYRFCSDELAGRLPTCERWDSGVDSFEITRNALADYENYWVIWGQSHDSVFFNPSNYYSRIMRVFGAVKHQMQWWASDYHRFNKNDWWKKEILNGVAWHEDSVGGLAGAVAVADGVNTLVAAFGRPQPGFHGYRSIDNVFEPTPMFTNAGYSHQTLISQVNCEARPIYASYDYSGYLPIPIRSGAIYERLAAYTMLGDPTTSFLATDQMNDIQRYLISYYTLFPKELTNVFGGMLANKTDEWGWHMTVDSEGKPKNCVRRNVVGPAAGKPTGEIWPFNPEPEYIFPTTRFRFPMLAAYYGLGLFLDSFDHSFVDVTRVYLKGHETAITPSDDAEVKTFEDPLSGKVYQAIRSKNNDVFHPAFHMMGALQEALGKYTSLQDLQVNYNFSDYQFILDKLELLRHMNHIYDYGEVN
jgi:hypothetical protein